MLSCWVTVIPGRWWKSCPALKSSKARPKFSLTRFGLIGRNAANMSCLSLWIALQASCNLNVDFIQLSVQDQLTERVTAGVDRGPIPARCPARLQARNARDLRASQVSNGQETSGGNKWRPLIWNIQSIRYRLSSSGGTSGVSF